MWSASISHAPFHRMHVRTMMTTIDRPCPILTCPILAYDMAKNGKPPAVANDRSVEPGPQSGSLHAYRCDDDDSAIRRMRDPVIVAVPPLLGNGRVKVLSELWRL